MDTRVSKSMFKAHTLEYLREVEQTGRALIVTDRGRPVLKIVPYRADPSELLHELKNSVVRYDAPFESTGVTDWESAH